MIPQKSQHKGQQGLCRQTPNPGSGMQRRNIWLSGQRVEATHSKNQIGSILHYPRQFYPFFKIIARILSQKEVRRVDASGLTLSIALCNSSHNRSSSFRKTLTSSPKRGGLHGYMMPCEPRSIETYLSCRIAPRVLQHQQHFFPTPMALLAVATA
jgi:hypothetical protein